VQPEITTEKAAELRLRASEERFRSLTKNIPVMLHTIDREGRLLSVSDAWLERLGCQARDVLGRPVTDFMTADSASVHNSEAMAQVVRVGACKDVELQFSTAAGSRIDVLLSAIAEYDDARQLSSAMAVLIDITERKAVERQLAHAQKMETVGQLTSGLAHDFNNLLGVVYGNLQLMERTHCHDQGLLRRIHCSLAAVERGAALTRRLLGLSRRQPLEPELAAPNRLIENMMGILRTTLGETIELRHRLAPSLPMTRIDPCQLEAALLNLAVNARDAMPHGGALEIETGIEHVDRRATAGDDNVSPGAYVSITVSDNGVGISRETLDRVFEPFFSTKETGKGSGLGLSMVQSFVKQAGGHVRITSEVGVGTSVRLLLPASSQNAAAHGEAPCNFAETGCGEVILVVEDKDDVRDVTAALLETLHYRILTARTGAEALKRLRSTASIDLLFTDLVLPRGMNGIELAREAQALRPSLAIVFASGSAQSELLNGAIGASRNVVLKPCSREELARKVRQALRERPFRHAPSARASSIPWLEQ
jgi:PAS domain S-box-containing protein